MENDQFPSHIAVSMALIILLAWAGLFLTQDAPMLVLFLLFYAAASFSYLIFRYLFAVISYPTHHFQHREKEKLPTVSIVIPAYNEEKGYLEQCIKSACEADYPGKELIMIDDGSPNRDCWETIRSMQKKYHFRAFKLRKNVGKRKAMAYGFRKARGEIVIAGDSDSVITSGRSIRRLVEPFKNPRVGSVAGCVLVQNAKKNLLTRMQDARYWLAFFIEKSSQNPYDSVTCAPGPFSAYRLKYLMEFLPEWEHQVFLGQECTYGDDRGLTTFMLRRGYDVKFARDALAYTNVPENLRTYMRQQIRWKKSFLRENYYMLGFILGNVRRKPLMVAEFFLFWLVFLSGFVAKVIMVVFLLSGKIRFLNFLLMIFFVAILHYLYAFLRSPGSRGYYGIAYGFANEFFLSWLIFPALFGLRDNKWGTR